jgi:hypothetical protein
MDFRSIFTPLLLYAFKTLFRYCIYKQTLWQLVTEEEPFLGLGNAEYCALKETDQPLSLDFVHPDLGNILMKSWCPRSTQRIDINKLVQELDQLSVVAFEQQKK